MLIATRSDSMSPPKSTTPLVSAIAATIRRVPRGRVSTYGAIAKAAGYPRCARHVGRVLKQVDGLPWHRILASGGRIAVPASYAFEQRFLLESEGIRFSGKKVNLRQFEHHFPARAAHPGANKGAGGAKPKSANRPRAQRLRGKL